MSIKTCLYIGYCYHPQVAELMKRLKTLHAQKLQQRRQQMRMRASQHQQQEAKLQSKRDQTTKQMKKRMYVIQGKMAGASQRKTSS